jgi:ATP-dependent Clp protease protease subunit
VTEQFDRWQQRIDGVWADDALDDDARIVAIDALAAELGAEHPVALFERAGARDSAGQETEAEPLYRAALAAGLDPERRLRATIQLASTIRNLGKIDEALAMLGQEYERSAGGALHDEAAAFYALALASAGDPDRGLAVALRALAPHLTYYARSVIGYAGDLDAPESSNASRTAGVLCRGRTRAVPVRCPGRFEAKTTNTGAAMAEPLVATSVFDRLLRDRIIWLGSEVRDENANEICAKILLLAAEDTEKDIYLYINSPGGSITAGMAIYDTMQFVPNDIVTVGIGMAASMGQLLLTAGAEGKRYITPNARVLLHQPHGGFGGTASDIQTQAQLILDMKKRLAEITAKRTGKTVEQINADGDRDRWFGAQEALEYGFVDHIRESASDVIGGGGTEKSAN